MQSRVNFYFTGEKRDGRVRLKYTSVTTWFDFRFVECCQPVTNRCCFHPFFFSFQVCLLACLNCSYFFVFPINPWFYLDWKKVKGLFQCVCVYEQTYCWLISLNMFAIFICSWAGRNPDGTMGAIGVKWWCSLSAAPTVTKRKADISHRQWAEWNCRKWKKKRIERRRRASRIVCRDV